MKKGFTCLFAVLLLTQSVTAKIRTLGHYLTVAGYAKVPLQFNTYHSYFQYLSIKALKGIDSANAYYRREFMKPIQANAYFVDDIFSGNVGIGTASPGINTAASTSNYVTIQGSGRAMLELATGASDADNIILGQIGFFGQNTTGSHGKQHTAILSQASGSSSNDRGGLLAFYTKLDGGSPSERLRIDANGNLGLGSTAPVSVNYSGTSPNFQISDRTSIFQLAGNGVTYVSNNLYYNSGWKYHQNGAGSYIYFGQGATAFIYAATNSSGANASADPQYSVYIDEAGKVGMGGNTSPAAVLDISRASGSTSMLRVKGYSDASTPYLLSLGTQTYQDNFQVKMVNGVATVGNTLNYALALTTNNTERFRIDANGNVGIGTAPTSDKLAVNGYISAKKITVTQLGWSDYVFAKDYKLRSLQSLESFINQYKHLPEVPTTKEVEAQGISVGDNQALLLKKIEELTLYVIDLQKQVNDLKNKK